MEQFPGAQFYGNPNPNPASAQNKSLISDTDLQ